MMGRAATKATVLRLTRERLRRGWSKAELARRARVDQGLVSKIELRRVNPYPVELARIARALRVPVRRAVTLLDEVREVVMA